MAATRPGARGASPGRVLRERGGGGAAVKATGKVAEPTARTARRSTSALYCTSVCCAYAATSVIITFANKILLSTYGFKFEMTLILAQLLVGTVVMKMLFSFGLCAPPSVDARSLRKSVPLAFWFLIYVTSGLGSLRSLSVPTWAALRRLTALFILIFDYAFDGKTAPLRIWMSVCLMLVGGLVAAAGDMEASAWGVAHVTLNCVSSALYLRHITALRSCAGVSEVGALYMTNILSILPVIIFIFAMGEASKVQAYPHLGDKGFQLALIGSAGLAGMLNYLVFLSATVNSPLTTSITGQAKNVIGSLGGYLLMPSSAGGGPVSERLLNVAGCCIGLCASMWYAMLKLRGR